MPEPPLTVTLSTVTRVQGTLHRYNHALICRCGEGGFGAWRWPIAFLLVLERHSSLRGPVFCYKSAALVGPSGMVLNLRPSPAIGHVKKPGPSDFQVRC